MKYKKGWIAAACLSALAVLTFVLFALKIIRFNTPSPTQYPVSGVDVSEYQGEIDWDTLASQDIDFAFLKATEGSAYTDPYFAQNREAVQATDLLFGAYHFFSFDSSAATQAENFIAAVPKCKGMLPPVLDVELYGAYKQKPPSREAVWRELDHMLALLEAHYGVKPIVYTTPKTYALYFTGRYEEYLLWMRDVYFTPNLPDGRPWSFWQYSDQGRLDGYRGKEKYIDLNVYDGSFEQLSELVLQ